MRASSGVAVIKRTQPAVGWVGSAGEGAWRGTGRLAPDEMRGGEAGTAPRTQEKATAPSSLGRTQTVCGSRHPVARGGGGGGWVLASAVVLSLSMGSLGVAGDCTVPSRFFHGGLTPGNCPGAGEVMGVGDACVVMCEDWLIMDPPYGNILTCHQGMSVPTASFNTSAPPCRDAVACDTMVEPERGTVGNCTYVDDLDFCLIGCPDGMEANTTSFCRDGVLEPAECIPQPCRDFQVPANGNAGDCAVDLDSGGKCEWECDYGYHPEGSASCNFGLWENSAACVIDKCEVEGPGDNAYGDGLGDCEPTISHGDTCEQACATGFIISGPARCDNSTFISGACLFVDQCPNRNSRGYCECPMHHYVSSNNCVKCPVGTYTHVPHPAYGPDTRCELVPTIDPDDRPWQDDGGGI